MSTINTANGTCVVRSGSLKGQGTPLLYSGACKLSANPCYVGVACETFHFMSFQLVYITQGLCAEFPSEFILLAFTPYNHHHSDMATFTSPYTVYTTDGRGERLLVSLPKQSGVNK